MAVVTFNYALWSARFPELAPKVSEPLATAYFMEAGIYCDNTDCSLVEDVNERTVYLNLITAHIAYINGASPAGAAGLVGRLASVTEGSVTIRTEYKASEAASWWIQSRYGAQYWQMTVRYRTMHYIPGDEPPTDPFAPWPGA